MLFLVACVPPDELGAHDGNPTTPDIDTHSGAEGEDPLRAEEVSLSDNEQVALEKRFAIRLSRPATVELGCTSPDDPLEDHLLPFDGQQGELRLHGLLSATRYECALGERGKEPLWTGAFDTAPLPEGFVDLAVSGDPDRATIDQGYVLFNHWKNGTPDRTHRLVVIDGEGRVRWYRTFEEALSGGIASTWLGEELVLGGGGILPSLQSLSGEVRFEVAPPLNPELSPDPYNHEVQMTPRGLLSLQTVPDTDGISTWGGFRIEVTDTETSEVVWRFDSADARLKGLLPPGSAELLDPYHVNAVTWRDDDPLGPSVWVSIRALAVLMRIDRVTGEISFLGPAYARLRDVSGSPAPETDWFWGQHAPQYYGDEILVYDNGGARPTSGRRYSRVALFRHDGPQDATLLWDWSEPGWFEPNFGMASRLPGGHVLVTTGHCANCPGTGGREATGWILELDPESDSVVWRFDFTDWSDSTYRAQALDGCEIFANRRFCPSL